MHVKVFVTPLYTYMISGDELAIAKERRNLLQFCHRSLDEFRFLFGELVKIVRSLPNIRNNF